MGSLGPLETAVMKGLWHRGSATAAELTSHINRHRATPLSSKTVLTSLTRLEGKGLVTHAKEKRSFRFYPALTEAETMAKLVGDQLETLIDRFGDLTVTVFVQRLGGTPHRLRQLRELLEVADERRHT